MSEDTNREYFRYRDALRGERLPLAFVDLDKFDRNVAYVAWTQRATGKTVRVHSKSLRCLSLLKRIFETGGEKYLGVMTFSVEETAWLADQGLDDFIVAYPSVQPSDMKLLARMAGKGKTVSLMIDCAEHLRFLSECGRREGTVLRACLDLDLSYRPPGTGLHLGIRRSPIRSVEEALSLAKESKSYKGVVIDSIMGYEGHIAGPNDDLPGQWLKNLAIRALKKASIKEFTPRRVNVVEEIRKQGLDIRAVNGGGSGSLVSTGRDPSVTEVTAGSAFYAPGLFRYFKEVSFVPSAFFGIQVVRRPAGNMVTCQGGGYVASGAAGKDKLPVPVYPGGLELLPLEGAGEVQTPFLLPKDCPELTLGDPVFLQHAKGGELAERFNEFYLVRGDRIVDKVKTYRGEGQAFL